MPAAAGCVRVVYRLHAPPQAESGDGTLNEFSEVLVAYRWRVGTSEDAQTQHVIALYGSDLDVSVLCQVSTVATLMRPTVTHYSLMLALSITCKGFKEFRDNLDKCHVARALYNNPIIQVQ